MKTKQCLIAEALRINSNKVGKNLDVGFAQNPNMYLEGDVYGIDIVSVPIPHPTIFNYKETKICDLNSDKIPYPDSFFDSVTMGCVLAHVSSPIRVLKEINRVLKPGGVLVFSSPNPHYYWEVILNIFFIFFKNRVSKGKLVEHFFEFSRYNARAICNIMGFEIIKEYGCSFSFIKLKIKFNPWYIPSIAYEIIYVAKKNSNPKEYTTTYDKEVGIKQVKTHF